MKTVTLTTRVFASEELGNGHIHSMLNCQEAFIKVTCREMVHKSAILLGR